jgi:hypothetical protein
MTRVRDLYKQFRLEGSDDVVKFSVFEGGLPPAAGIVVA